MVPLNVAKLGRCAAFEAAHSVLLLPNGATPAPSRPNVLVNVAEFGPAKATLDALLMLLKVLFVLVVLPPLLPELVLL